MSKARSDGLFFLVLGILTFIVFGAFLKHRATDSMVDFKMLYYGSRTLLEHGDPYNRQAFSKLFRTEFGESAFIERHASMAVSINLPTTYFLSAPLAMLPFWLASTIWSLLTGASLIAAACLVWRLGASYAPILSGALAGFALLNGSVAVGNGNSAGVIVGLCVIAACCFVTERAVWLGVLCFAVSLIVKPQDSGLLWLFFLLAGAVTRKRALQAAGIAILLALPAAFWVSRSAPQWIPELHSNLVEISAQGGNCDPGPAGLTGKSGTMEVITDLQAAISVFRDSPSFYNPATLLICGALFILLLLMTLRTGYSSTLAWTALAAITPMTLLVTYHRAYDARLLLLAVPSCSMLWVKGGFQGRAAAAVTAAALFFTGEVPLAFLNPLLHRMHVVTGSPMGKLETVLLMRLAPLTLLAMCLVFLWMCWREYRIWPATRIRAAGDREPASAGRV
ncbi:MAG: glycosyltransferase family 87 protein [Terracidiphilus sp.]